MLVEGAGGPIVAEMGMGGGGEDPDNDPEKFKAAMDKAANVGKAEAPWHMGYIKKIKEK